MPRILVVDDERNVRVTLEALFQSAGHEVELAESGEAALMVMRRCCPDLLLTDLRMDGMSGIDLVAKSRELFPSVTSVIMTAYGTIDSAVEAIRRGAYDFLLKPFTPEQIEMLVARVMEFRALREERERLTGQVAALTEPSMIESSDDRMLKLLEVARRVALSESTLLVTGESGTGKSLLAQMIHARSPRSQGPFAVVNCATLSENLLESELFGHVKGAFTGAIRDKIGRLQAADRGTVFLDELAEISPGLQTKLLRFLQEREFERVGDTKTIRVDVRIIAATNKDLEREVREGRFREDLYFRLNVIELRMPALRERPGDIIPLAERLLSRARAALGKPPIELSREARDLIKSYPWPGNIRELKNALERAAILAGGAQIEASDLPDRVQEGRAAVVEALERARRSPSSPESGGVSLEELELRHIRNVLATTGTLEEAATVLGINLSTLWRKRRRYGLD